MTPKINFSFEVYYPAHAGNPPAERSELMGMLGPVLQELLAAQDSAASVVVSDTHKGPDHKIAEVTTTLQDAQIAELLQTFSMRHGVVVSALE